MGSNGAESDDAEKYADGGLNSENSQSVPFIESAITLIAIPIDFFPSGVFL